MKEERMDIDWIEAVLTIIAFAILMVWLDRQPSSKQ